MECSQASFRVFTRCPISKVSKKIPVNGAEKAPLLILCRNIEKSKVLLSKYVEKIITH